MAEEKTEVAETAESEGLTAEEQALFEASRNETPAPEPEQAETPAPEAKPAEQKAEGEDGKTKTVPHENFAAMHGKYKDARDELQDLRSKYAVMEDRWNTLLKAGEADQPKEETPPDPNEDIFAYTKWQADRLASLEGKITNQEKQAQARAQENQVVNQLMGEFNRSRAEFSQQTPDFDNAAKYLSDMRTGQLKAMGYSDQQIDAQINREVIQGIAMARQNNMDPAALFYQYAHASGYKPNGKENGEAKADDKITMPDKLAGIAAAQESAKTVGAASGGRSMEPESGEAIAQMSQEEFDAWYSKPENVRRMQKMMGG